MSLLIDLIPVIAFFAAFRIGHSLPEQIRGGVEQFIGPLSAGAGTVGADELATVIFATVVAILATAVQIAVLLLRRKQIKPMVWVSALLIVFFGGLTIWLRNEWFIKWKPSILYAIFGAVLAGSKLVSGRNLLGSILGPELELPAVAWDRLMWAWVGFFLAMAALNLAVAYSVDTTSWVNFKTFGMPILTLAFSMLSTLLILRPLRGEDPGDAKPAGENGEGRA